jgi:hypothetical protein
MFVFETYTVPVDAQYLVNQMQIYYLADVKYAAVQTFNHNPIKFDYETLINDLKGELPQIK